MLLTIAHRLSNDGKPLGTKKSEAKNEKLDGKLDLVLQHLDSTNRQLDLIKEEVAMDRRKGRPEAHGSSNAQTATHFPTVSGAAPAFARHDSAAWMLCVNGMIQDPAAVPSSKWQAVEQQISSAFQPER